MAIFAGDIPGCLLRMPGTPASAAYTDEAYAMTQQGPGRARARRRPRVLGGRRPVRHRGADRRGAGARRVRAQVQLVRVLLAGAAGPDLRRLHLDRPAAEGPGHRCCSACSSPASASTTRRRYPRFTFGNAELLGGIGLIPLMIGMFAVSRDHALRRRLAPRAARSPQAQIGNVFKGMWALARQVPEADPARQRARHGRSARCPAPAPTSRPGCRTR